MILVDTSVWIDHFRTPNLVLARLMADEAAYLHPLVFGELCMGDLRPRRETVRTLLRLPFTRAAADIDVLTLVENEALFASGLSFIDAHLLTSAVLDRRFSLLTRDKRLAAASARLNIAADS